MKLSLSLIRPRKMCRMVWKLLPTAFLIALAAAAVSPGLPVSAAVDLTYFTAQVEGAAVRVSWRTATERGNMGFRLLKSTSNGGPWENKGEFHTTCPGCILGSNYSYSDAAVSASKTYYYKLQTIDTGKQYGPVTVSLGVSAATATATMKSSSTSTANATATRTSTSTSTSTRAPVVAFSATPNRVAAAAATPLPATATNTPVSTAARAATATPSPQPGPSRSMQGTPTQKIAYAVKPSPIVRASPPAARAQPTFAAPVPTLSSQAASHSLAPSLDASLEASLAESAEMESETEPSAAAPTELSLLKLALYGLTCVFGLGSLVFGSLAISLLARNRPGA